MSLNSIINTSLSGLFTNQSAMQVTSNNIANVNTPGYARLVVSQESSVVQGSTNGVQIGRIDRVVDEFLEVAHRTANSNTAEYTIESQFHSRVQGLLGRPDATTSLSGRMDKAFTAIADLALNPSDVLRRQQTLSEVQSYLDTGSLIQNEIQTLRSDASEQMKEKVADANDLLQRIYEINPLLGLQKLLGKETGGLQGQLDTALNELSTLMDIKVRNMDDGKIRVSTTSGVTLVDESLSQLTYAAPGIVNSGTYFPPIQVAVVDPDTLEAVVTPRDLNGHIKSGELRGLIEVRDTQLRDLSVTLGELTANVMDQLNEVHNGFSAAPPPNVLEGKVTAISGNNATGFTGIVNFAVVDANQKIVATHQVDFDAAPPSPNTFTKLISDVNAGLGGDGTLALTNGVMTLTATNSAHGAIVADDTTTPSDRGGRGFSHFFGMNDMVRASEPGIYETGFVTTDLNNLTAGEEMTFRVLSSENAELTTVTVAIGAGDTTMGDVVNLLNDVAGLGAYVTYSLDSSGKLDWENNGTVSGVSVQLVSDNTQMGSTTKTFSSAFGLDDKFRVDAAKKALVMEDLSDNPSLLALSAFDETAVVGDVAVAAGDQRGALALQNLETSLVLFSDAGELKATNVTMSQYTAQFLGNAGLMAKRAESLEQDNDALKSELFQRKSEASGVNLDEELANLIVYQNAYGAAARVLSSAQEMYDTLINI